MDEVETWRATRAGDGAAFARLWDLHRDRVFRTALRIAETRTDAEDLVAGAFLELWRRREAVRVVDGSVLPWLLATVYNLGRNANRGLRRHRAFLATLPPPAAAADHAETSLDRVAALREERSLVAVVRSLPAVHRDILALVVIEDLSIADAAQVLGIRTDAAKVRLSRARARVRDAWSPAALRLEEGSTP